MSIRQPFIKHGPGMGPESRIVFPLGREGKICPLLSPITDPSGIASGLTRIPHLPSPSVGALQSFAGPRVFLVIGFDSKISANANNVIKPNSKGYLHGRTLLDSGNGNEQYKKKLSKFQTMATDCAGRGSQLIQLSAAPLGSGRGNASGHRPDMRPPYATQHLGNGGGLGDRLPEGYVIFRHNAYHPHPAKGETYSAGGMK
jgi:hypothetical protein